MNLKKTVTDFKLHWSRPPFGYFVPYKEIAAYSAGGMGNQFAISLSLTIVFSAGNMLIGNTIGIRPTHIQLLSIISTILGFFITAGRAYIIDNTRSKKGKFRPYLLYMGIPTVALSVIFVYLPFDKMAYGMKFFAVLFFYNVIQLFLPFYQYSYTNLAMVISPNSQERTNIISVSTIILSVAPTITGFIVPFFSEKTGGLNNINTYRFFYPAFCVIGLIISYFAYFGTKERIVQAKSHVVEIKFMDAIRAVCKNKYFWITSLAGWVGFLEGATGVILGWTFVYGHPDKMELYAVLNTLIGNSALIAMLIAPWVISRLGKRKLLIFCNVANIFLLGLLYPVIGNYWLMFILMYLNGFFNAFANIYNPSIQADLRDYQQYLTGERIDGMFSTVGLLGSVVGMGTGMVVPAIYEQMGLTTNYDVLKNEALRNNLFHVLIIASVIGAALNVIPYFFYDLTEDKHKSIVDVLRIRALFEDYGNGELSDEDLADTIDMIHKANALYAETPVQLNRDMIRLAKAEGRGAVRAAKREFRAIQKHNIDIKNAHIIVDEMNKFSTPLMQYKVKMAKEIYARGLEGLLECPESVLREARQLPGGTKEEKAIRAAAIEMAKNRRRSRKLLPKYYPNGLEEPNPQRMQDALNLPETTPQETRARKKAVKAAVDEKSRFNRAAKPFVDSRRLLTEEENYKHFDEIHDKYEDAKARAIENRRRAKEENDRLEAEKLADIERLKQERLQKLSPEKREKLLEKQRKKEAHENAKKK